VRRSRGAIEEMRGEVMAGGIRARGSSAEEECHLSSLLELESIANVSHEEEASFRQPNLLLTISTGFYHLYSHLSGTA